MTEPRFTWSYSSWNNFQECGERYRLEKVAKVAVPIRWASVAGTAVHTATEQHDHGNRDVNWLEVLEATVAGEEEHTKIPRSMWLTSRDEDERWWQDNGADMLRMYQEWRERTNWDIPLDLPPDVNGGRVGIEYALDVDVEGVPFIGYVDRLMDDGRGLIVMDIKAGRPRSSRRQLEFYVAMCQAAGIDASRGVIYKAREGKLGRIFQLDTTDQDLYSWTRHDTEARQAGRFEAKPDRHCDWCLVRDYCQYA